MAYRKTALVAALAAVSFASPAVAADTITTFDANGIFADMSTLSGKVVIDTTAGTVQSATLNISAVGALPTNFYTNSSTAYNIYSIQLGTGLANTTLAVLDLPVSSLIGYSGSDFYSYANPPSVVTQTTAYETFGANGLPTSAYRLVIGSLAPEQVMAAVPEPASWAMMIGGFGLVGGVMRRRQRRLAVSFA